MKVSLPRLLAAIDAAPRRRLAALALAWGVAATAVQLAGLAKLGQLDIGTIEYERIAAHVAAGRGFVFEAGERPVLWRPPLYIWLLAGLGRAGLPVHGAAMALQSLLHGAIGVAVLLAGERLLSRRAGLLAAMALPLYPVFTINAGRLMPESLYAALLAGAVLAWLALWERPRPAAGAGLGLLLGVGVLTKASVQFLVPFLLAWVAVFGPKGRRRPLGLALAVALAVQAAVLAPWAARNGRVSGGEFIPVDTSGGYTFWVGNRLVTDGCDDDPMTPEERDGLRRDLARILGVPYHPRLNVAEVAWSSAAASSALYREALRGIARRPLAWAGLAVRKIGRFWFCYIGERGGAAPAIAALQGALLLPAALGAILARRRRRPLGGLWPVLVYFPLLHALSTASARYTVPLLPWVVLLAAYGVAAAAGLDPRPAPAAAVDRAADRP